MRVFYSEEMKQIDAFGINELGMPGVMLMETAGRQVAEEVLELLGTSVGKKVLVFAGKGNNAGDAFVCARYLFNQGISVKIVLLADSEYQGDALSQLKLLKKCKDMDFFMMKSETDFNQVLACGKMSDLIIDGILGTGFHGELSSSFMQAIDLINSLNLPVVAIDLPSGVFADSGKIGKSVVRATITVAMTALKPGLVLYPGAEFAGEVLVADLGIPDNFVQDFPNDKALITETLIADLLPQRPRNAHKGTSGRVAIVAGSPGFIGAAALCSMAAVKAGAGLVSLFTPLSVKDMLAIKLTEVMVHGLLERLPGILGGGAIGEIFTETAAADVLAMGPGLGRAEATQEVILEIIAKSDKPLVLDADALTALKGHTDILKDLRVPKVLTPHPGEMAALTGGVVETIDENRLTVAAKYAEEWDCVLVLKGAPAVVAWPNGSVYINTTGNEGMATGGTGDVLTGIIAALIAQGLPAEDAAVVGVWLHGLAGDLAAVEGKIGLTATRLTEFLPKARQLAEGNIS